MVYSIQISHINSNDVYSSIPKKGASSFVYPPRFGKQYMILWTTSEDSTYLAGSQRRSLLIKLHLIRRGTQRDQRAKKEVALLVFSLPLNLWSPCDQQNTMKHYAEHFCFSSIVHPASFEENNDQIK